MWAGKSTPSRTRKRTSMKTVLVLFCCTFLVVVDIEFVTSMSIDRLGIDRNNELQSDKQISGTSEQKISDLIVEDEELEAVPAGGETELYVLLPAGSKAERESVNKNTIESDDVESSVVQENGGDMIMMESQDTPVVQVVNLPPIQKENKENLDKTEIKDEDEKKSSSNEQEDDEPIKQVFKNDKDIEDIDAIGNDKDTDSNEDNLTATQTGDADKDASDEESESMVDMFADVVEEVEKEIEQGIMGEETVEGSNKDNKPKDEEQTKWEETVEKLEEKGSEKHKDQVAEGEAALEAAAAVIEELMPEEVVEAMALTEMTDNSSEERNDKNEKDIIKNENQLNEKPTTNKIEAEKVQIVQQPNIEHKDDKEQENAKEPEKNEEHKLEETDKIESEIDQQNIADEVKHEIPLQEENEHKVEDQLTEESNVEEVIKPSEEKKEETILSDTPETEENRVETEAESEDRKHEVEPMESTNESEQHQEMDIEQQQKNEAVQQQENEMKPLESETVQQQENDVYQPQENEAEEHHEHKIDLPHGNEAEEQHEHEIDLPQENEAEEHHENIMDLAQENEAGVHQENKIDIAEENQAEEHQESELHLAQENETEKNQENEVNLHQENEAEEQQTNEVNSIQENEAEAHQESEVDLPQKNEAEDQMVNEVEEHQENEVDLPQKNDVEEHLANEVEEQQKNEIDLPHKNEAEEHLANEEKEYQENEADLPQKIEADEHPTIEENLPQENEAEEHQENEVHLQNENEAEQHSEIEKNEALDKKQEPEKDNESNESTHVENQDQDIEKENSEALEPALQIVENHETLNKDEEKQELEKEDEEMEALKETDNNTENTADNVPKEESDLPPMTTLEGQQTNDEPIKESIIIQADEQPVLIDMDTSDNGNKKVGEAILNVIIENESKPSYEPNNEIQANIETQQNIMDEPINESENEKIDANESHDNIATQPQDEKLQEQISHENHENQENEEILLSPPQKPAQEEEPESTNEKETNEMTASTMLTTIIQLPSQEQQQQQQQQTSPQEQEQEQQPQVIIQQDEMHTEDDSKVQNEQIVADPVATIASSSQRPQNVAISAAQDSVLNYVNATNIISSTLMAEKEQQKQQMETENVYNNKTEDLPFNSQLRRYDGAQVWRIVVQNDRDRRLADELQTKYDGQLWKEVKQEVDYLLKPQILAEAEKHIRAANLSRIVLIDNLQKVIEVENPAFDDIADADNEKGHRLTWQSYHRLADIHDFFDYLAKTYPEICAVETIGYSIEKRPLKVLKISNGNAGNPSVWMDGGMHAREWISPASLTYIANQLAEGWENIPSYMQNINWYIHAVANPDGYEYTHTTDRLWRKNMRSHGRQSCPGVDLNRNFGYKWGGKGTSANPCSQIYRGSKAFSEPETFYISKFISGFPRDTFHAFLSFHSYGQYILYPWGYDYALTNDRSDLDRVARAAATTITRSSGVKYTVGPSATTLYPAAGGSDDWAKGIANIKYTYTIEMGDTGRYGFILPANQIEPNGKDAYTFVQTVARAISHDMRKRTIKLK